MRGDTGHVGIRKPHDNEIKWLSRDDQGQHQPTNEPNHPLVTSMATKSDYASNMPGSYLSLK